MGDEAKSTSAQTIQFVLNEHLELSVNRDERQPRVARLLQSLDEQRPVARRGEDVRVEIVSFHARGVGQNDPSNAEGRKLGPEPPHHFRPRERKEQINRRTARHARVERAAHIDPLVGGGLHDTNAERAVEDSHAHLMSGRDLQDVQQMQGARARQAHIA